ERRRCGVRRAALHPGRLRSRVRAQPARARPELRHRQLVHVQRGPGHRPQPDRRLRSGDRRRRRGRAGHERQGAARRGVPADADPRPRADVLRPDRLVQRRLPDHQHLALAGHGRRARDGRPVAVVGDDAGRRGRVSSTRVLVPTDRPPRRAEDVEHHVVYRDENEFAAWPYYCGLWQTADGSLVAGFKRVPTDYRSISHYDLVNRPGEIVVIRSTDGGRTWDRNSVVPVFDMSITSEEELPGGAAADWTDLPPLDFTSRDTLLMGGGIPKLMSGGAARAWIRASTDGGRTWRPPALLPNWDFPGVSLPGTSMYSVRGDGVMLFGVQAWAPGVKSPLPVVYASHD